MFDLRGSCSYSSICISMETLETVFRLCPLCPPYVLVKLLCPTVYSLPLLPHSSHPLLQHSTKNSAPCPKIKSDNKAQRRLLCGRPGDGVLVKAFVFNSKSESAKWGELKRRTINPYPLLHPEGLDTGHCVSPRYHFHQLGMSLIKVTGHSSLALVVKFNITLLCGICFSNPLYCMFSLTHIL